MTALRRLVHLLRHGGWPAVPIAVAVRRLPGHLQAEVLELTRRLDKQGRP